MRFEAPWNGRFRLQTYHHRAPEALPPEAVAAIRAEILAASELGETTLTSQFSGTYGFSIAFRRDAKDEVCARFPAFRAFLDLAMIDGCDGFLLNPLLVTQGRAVAPHIDQSLEGYAPGIGCPVAVSVLYVQVPEDLQGGELRLSHRGAPVAALAPEARALVTFRGDVVHEVTAIEAGAPGVAHARISLVLEQYRCDAAARARLPRLDLRTRSGMAAGGAR